MMHETCEQCGHAFSPSAAPGGMCPRCLLFGGADEQPPDDLSLEELRDAVPGFRVESQLGRGGMGAVFRARQLDLDRDVAIKFIAERADDPSFGERFEREARTMARLNHPNIVTIHSHGRTADGHGFIVMEYVAGGDLAQLIAAGRIPEPVALSLVEQVCSALAYAHEQGCVHRDIKPGNILIDTKGRVKVADFGLVKLLGESAATSALTVTGLGVGTPLYAAPEQTKLGAPVDHRADIYALGVLLYEMLTGEVPRGIFQSPSVKSGTLVRWDRVIVRAMDAQPERRYASTAELGRELVVIRRELALRGHPLRWWKRVALAALVLALACAAPLLLPVDYSISRSGGDIVLTEKSAGGVLTVSQPEPGRIRFAAADRTFRDAFLWRTRGTSDFPLAGSRFVVRVKGAVRIEDDLALGGASLVITAESLRVEPGANVVATGPGGITVTTPGPIVVGKGASLQTHDGTLALSANAAATTAGAFIGVDVDGGLVQATGTGIVTVTGNGGNAASQQHGVHVHGGGDIIGGTLGTTTVSGNGGAANGANVGVRLSGSGSTIGSGGAHVRVVGQGGGVKGANYSYGIDLNPHAQISAGGLGSVTVIGTGAHGPGWGDYCIGIALLNASTITSSGGNVSVTGTGGTGTKNEFAGIHVGEDSTITASGVGTVTVVGKGGTVSGENKNTTIGIDLRSSGTITSAGGDVSVTGIAGNGTDGTPGANAGVRVFGDSAITAGGTGAVSVTGTGASGSGPDAQGIFLSGQGDKSNLARIGATDGVTTLTATAGNASSHALMVGTHNAGRIVTGNNNPITIFADSIDLGPAAILSSGTGTTTLRPRTAGVRINLGSILGPTPGTLELSQDEMDKITARTLHIGDGESGDIITSTRLTPHGSLDIATGGRIKLDTRLTIPPGSNCTIRAASIEITLPGAGIVASGPGGITLEATRQILLWEKTRISTAEGPLSVRTDSLDLHPETSLSSATGSLHIVPHTPGARIHLGGTDAPGDPPTLGLSDDQLERITAPIVQIGDERSGEIIVTEPISEGNRGKLPRPARTTESR